MSRKVTGQSAEEKRKGWRYNKKRDELQIGWEEACSCGMERVWYEKTICTWCDTRQTRKHSEGGVFEEQGYIDSLQEHILPELQDEDYVEMLLKVRDLNNIPAYIVLITRDILSRRLRLDRNAESVKNMLDWCANQVTGNPQTGLVFQNGQEKSKTGIQFLAESIVLTGELKQREMISEVEKSILLLAGNELIGRCVRSGMLVKEMAQEYIDYALSYGDRSILPVLIALKYKEEV